jgi:leucyl aminopeptidase
MAKHFIKVASTVPAFAKDAVFVVGAELKGTKLTLVSEGIDLSSLKNLDLDKLGVKATKDALVKAPGPNGSFFAIVGGYKAKDVDSLRYVGGTIGRLLNEFKTVVIALPVNSEVEALALLEGYSVGNYSYTAYKSDAKKAQVQTMILATKVKVKPATITRVEILRAAVHDTRDLVSMPANDLYPQSFASLATKLAKGSAVTITILDEKKLASGGFGGMIGVGKGSVRPPRIVKVEYKPVGAKKKIAFVGKGITYDTGGLSLKPAISMLGMKYDMTGAATVLSAVLAIARLKLKVQATAYLCLAENMPSGSATRPGDVIKMRNGKTVEVTNPDAEGRLVLGDGMSLASESYPDLIVDVATLTGGQRTALGTRYAGLMGDDESVEALLKATKATGEFAWPMPFPEELRLLLNSDIADMMNSRLGNPTGSMLVGGLFLKEFVGKKSKTSDELIPWVHIDLAGPADNDGAGYGFIPKGATGSYVRSLVALAESYSR